LEATDGVKGGFTENDLLGSSIAHPEVACVFAGAGRKTSPEAVARAAQFGANRTIGFPSDHEEDRVAAGVRVQLALVDTAPPHLSSGDTLTRGCTT
jgi:hypothetical protein